MAFHLRKDCGGGVEERFHGFQGFCSPMALGMTSGKVISLFDLWAHGDSFSKLCSHGFNVPSEVGP